MLIDNSITYILPNSVIFDNWSTEQPSQDTCSMQNNRCILACFKHRDILKKSNVGVNLRFIPYCAEDVSVFPDLLTLTACVTLTL